MKILAYPLGIVRLCDVSHSTHRYASLDGTRGLAVLLVFFVHYHALFSNYVSGESFSFKISEALEAIGHSGVDLFFMLSGYLIYGILIQKPVSYFSFQWRRIKRTYPTFLTVLILYLSIFFVFPKYSKVPSGLFEASGYILENVALLPGITATPPIITVSWTLSYEFVFYLGLPLLISAVSMRSWKRWQRVLLIMSLVSLFVGFSTIIQCESYLRFSMFGVGILLWETLNCSRIKVNLPSFGEPAAISIYLVSLALIYWFRYHPIFIPTFTDIRNVQGESGVILTAIGSFVFGLYCFGFDGFLNRVFSWGPIRWLGGISYSYYLIHGITLKAFAFVMNTCIPPSGHAPLVFWSAVPFALLMTFISATLLFVLVEKPFSLSQGRTTVRVPSVLGNPRKVHCRSDADEGHHDPSVSTHTNRCGCP